MLFLGEAVKEAGFADVWATDEGDFECIFFALLCVAKFVAGGFELMFDFGAKFVKMKAGSGGSAHHVLDAKAVEFFVWQRFAEVGFVEEKHGWLAALECLASNHSVVLAWIFATVERKENHVGIGDRVIDLILNASLEFVVRIFKAGGIDKKILVFDGADNVVARSALFARNNSLRFANEAIKEAGLASVGLADDGDNR